MIEVRIPSEIKSYREKLFFGLNLRQTISAVIALAVCIPLYIIGQKYIDEGILSWLIIAIAAPLILTGFFKFNEMHFEQFIVAWFKMQWNPQKRKFKHQPIYEFVKYELEDLDKNGNFKIKKKK